MSQREQLAVPFPAQLIKAPPKGKYGSYVQHSTVTERLLSIVGPFTYEITQVIFGVAPAIYEKGTGKVKWPAREHAVVGCIARLTVTIDGETVSVEEAGDVENPAMETDGRNLKDASSDAIKRCAMRVGLGLHLWSQDDYFLDRQLAKDAQSVAAAVDGPVNPVEEIPSDGDDPGAVAPLSEPEPDEDDEPVEAPVDDDQSEYPPWGPGPGPKPMPEGKTPLVDAALAKQRLESEIAIDIDRRMKCPGQCEYLDPYTHDEPCCQDAHLRRLYQLAQAGLAIKHDGESKDLLHQALKKAGVRHVSQLRKAQLEDLISRSIYLFTGMIYGTGTIGNPNYPRPRDHA